MVTEVAIASTGNWFIVASDDGSATKYAKSGDRLQVYRDDLFNESLTSIALSPDDKWFLVSSRIIVTKFQQIVTKLQQRNQRERLSMRTSMSEDSKLDVESLMSGGSIKKGRDDKFKGLILKWDLDEGKYRHTLHSKHNHRKKVTEIALEPVAKRTDPVKWFATSSNDCTIKI